LWVFDRGIVSEDNLEGLRQRGAHYLVGAPKSQLKACGQKLLDGGWRKISDEVQVQLIPEADEVHVLCRSTGRVQKERATCLPAGRCAGAGCAACSATCGVCGGACARDS
jgi:hypothetical protein